MTTIYDWRELPFREIWVVDTEFYPGPGLANGGVAGDPATPLCLVALELRSGRLVRLWQDQLGPFPPYRLDDDALIVGYMLAAEFGTHIALGWGEPARALDAYIEFRHYVNDGSIRSSEREKGFSRSPVRCDISSKTRSTSPASTICGIALSKARRSAPKNNKTSWITARMMFTLSRG